MTGQLEESENQKGDTQPETRRAALWLCREGKEAGKVLGTVGIWYDYPDNWHGRKKTKMTPTFLDLVVAGTVH